MKVIFTNEYIEIKETNEEVIYTEIDAKKLYILINEILENKDNLDFECVGIEPIAKKMYEIFKSEFQGDGNIE